ncbi:MAG: hypothetical protein SF052_19370 [Bacteroidia bacterium]|nr:hypothetical protein [Bacteroidia bacterium]
MKFFYKYLLLLFAGLMISSLHAQPFSGYQTIGVHTWYFSVSWQGKPLLGLGYNLRIAGRTFTDLNAEWRFPIDQVYNMDDYQVIFGMYKPFAVRKWFMSMGVHGRIDKHTNDSSSITNLGLALTLLPSYTYASSLNDGAYGTTGLRATYMPVLASKIKIGSATPQWKTLTGHRVEAGGHLDFHYERTVSLVTNGFFTRTWSKDESLFRENSDQWRPNGDLYFGTTYYLKRLKF